MPDATSPSSPMRFSVGLPVERPDRFAELGSGSALAELSQAAEELGYDAVSVTDHPFPPERWLRSGGHHTHDPLVALAYVAAATSSIRIHTNILVLPYRNAFLAAKGAASLDALSDGRLILGVAAGYLEGEFSALGADISARNDMLDEGIRAMRAAWSGTPLQFEGTYFRADGNVMLPQPVQPGGPPIWIGGNSTRAIRRAVELGQGWMPFPQSSGASRYTRTPDIDGVEDLRARIDVARRLATEAGRAEALDICFVPFGLSLLDKRKPDFGAVAASVAELRGLGVTWLSIMLQGETRKAFLEQLTAFADEVIRPSR
jgi:probable F420-dependent oxidoreductase